MNDEISSDNPYSRLMALKRMNVVKNYEDIRKKTILIIGLGGIGSVAAEMLTRCGIGKLILYDYDIVELANMNRMFYLPSQVSLTKVEAAKATLHSINPETEINTHHADITALSSYTELLTHIRTGGIQAGAIDLLLCCVDNYSARVTINKACLETDLVWVESGVSENAMSGHIQFVIPGQTACFLCAAPLAVSEQIDEAQIKREGVCAASLPTTMTIIAGFMVQNTLKYLLGFGKTSHFLAYNAFVDFFPSDPLFPNPQCTDPMCLTRQMNFEENPVCRLDPFQQKSEEVKEEESIAENEWGIQIVDESEEKVEGKQEVRTVEVEETQSLQDLMADLQKLQQ
jgi:ubiquitin-like modifier-activating enzyme 5